MINAVSNIGSFYNNTDTSKNEALELSRKLLDNENNHSFNKVFSRINNFLNLGSTKYLDFSHFSEKEMESFLKVLSVLMKEGIVVYAYYEANGRIEKHFITTSLGNRKLYNDEPKYIIKLNDNGWLV